ncbi:MAG: NAD(P)/FAD-dependent oxidoreductase [Chitinophagaceae bacterium]
MKTAVIIGAGPAGLTAAYELLIRTDIKPIVIEADKQPGGLSKTIDYKGNKIDIGGHRFFSKSKKVLDWWLHFLPIDPKQKDQKIRLRYQNKETDYTSYENKINDTEKIMLVRKRKSRIYYNKKFFDYPLGLNSQTIKNLGSIKMIRIGFSYLKAKLFPIKKEETLEQFFKNRFGNELYHTFFKDYTEKVWGVPCSEIPAAWGQQRVKNLNISKVISHAIRSVLKKDQSIQQGETSTSLIEQFLYPKFGPGQLWQAVADEIIKLGGTILYNTKVIGLTGDEKDAINFIETKDSITNETQLINADYVFSTMPVKSLVQNLHNLPVPGNVKSIASNLKYRDFLIVGILVDELLIKNKEGEPVTDNWIYIQDKNVKAGRLQLFHNWSPYMTLDPNTSWIGVEYFCNEDDELWNKSDRELIDFVVDEMETIGILQKQSVKDAVVIRVKKAYPSYYGAYENFDEVKTFLDKIKNLYLVGRNGMHRYNNSDHSMLTAMEAVDLIIKGSDDKSSIWEINTGDEYHEEE